jgi:putative chitobiose transport system permease protein
MSALSAPPRPTREPVTTDAGGRRRRRRHSPAGLILRYLLLLLMTVVLIGPFVWQLSVSLKGAGENIFADPTLIPRHPTLDNFAKVSKAIPIWHFIVNSLVVAAISVASNLVFGSMAGYALARMRFRGRNAVFVAVLSTMIIPFEVIMVSLFLVVKGMGLVNTLLAAALPGAVTGLSILLMRNAFLALPREVEEAAWIDGAQDWRVFTRVALPSVRGALTVVGVFSFVFAWDDFLWPLIVLRDNSNYTLTIGLQFLSGTFSSDQRLIAAGTMVALLPLLVLFFSLQRLFFRGAGEGAVKG